MSAPASLPKENLIGYVIVDTPGEAVARLLYHEWRITQNWFPIAQCIEHCIACGVTDPKVYTQEEFLKVVRGYISRTLMGLTMVTSPQD